MDWSRLDVEAIVADYLQMLTLELAGQSYNKTTHRENLKLKLQGEGQNRLGLGAKITIFSKDKKQFLEQMPTRGYQSSVSPILHFGLGENATIDSLNIVWLSGKQEWIKNIKYVLSFIMSA